jgi:MFS family permease
MVKNLSSTAWSPFRHKAFTVLWIATVVAYIGSWMYSATAAWLMTSLSQNPLTVSLVQVASTLPVFLFALPAGALADMTDKRRFLLAGETFTAIVATAFATLVWFHHITPVTRSRCPDSARRSDPIASWPRDLSAPRSRSCCSAPRTVRGPRLPRASWQASHGSLS